MTSARSTSPAPETSPHNLGWHAASETSALRSEGSDQRLSPPAIEQNERAAQRRPEPHLERLGRSLSVDVPRLGEDITLRISRG